MINDRIGEMTIGKAALTKVIFEKLNGIKVLYTQRKRDRVVLKTFGSSKDWSLPLKQLEHWENRFKVNNISQDMNLRQAENFYYDKITRNSILNTISTMLLAFSLLCMVFFLLATLNLNLFNIENYFFSIWSDSDFWITNIIALLISNMFLILCIFAKDYKYVKGIII